MILLSGIWSFTLQTSRALHLTNINPEIWIRHREKNLLLSFKFSLLVEKHSRCENRDSAYRHSPIQIIISPVIVFLSARKSTLRSIGLLPPLRRSILFLQACFSHLFVWKLFMYTVNNMLWKSIIKIVGQRLIRAKYTWSRILALVELSQRKSTELKGTRLKRSAQNFHILVFKLVKVSPNNNLRNLVRELCDWQ